MAPIKVPASVHDFQVLPLQLPPQPAFPKEATHYLYLRANAPKVPTETTPREVFLVNVPVDATETCIHKLFAHQLGGVRIESVAFEGARTGRGIAAPVAPTKPSKKRKRSAAEDENGGAEEVGLLPECWDRELHGSGGTAVVTFVDRASADRALKEVKRAVKSRTPIRWTAAAAAAARGGGEQHGRSDEPPLGSARYRTNHALRYPDHAALQDSVDAYMTAFAAQEAARAQLLARQRSEPDADGFITVTRGGRAGPAREEEARAKEQELQKRERNRVKEDFYRFQVREKKKELAKDLVRGFEADQRTVEEMKRRRGKIRPE